MVRPETVVCRQVAAELLQMGAVQMDHASAALAPQQKARPGAAVDTELVQRPFSRVHPVDAAHRLQPLQLAVYGGQPHRALVPPQDLRDLAGGEGLLRPALQTAEDGLSLSRVIGHMTSPI